MSGPTAELNANPNLVPLLDMVFQLITFFMLVVNFKSAEIDRSLTLPVIGSARRWRTRRAGPRAQRQADKEHPDGYLDMQGTPQLDIPGYIGHEAMVQRMATS